MRADLHVVGLREADGVAHDHRVARVEAARDVGHRDERHDRGVVAERPHAVALAHVAFELDARAGARHRASVPTPAPAARPSRRVGLGRRRQATRSAGLPRRPAPEARDVLRPVERRGLAQEADALPPVRQPHAAERQRRRQPGQQVREPRRGERPQLGLQRGRRPLARARRRASSGSPSSRCMRYSRRRADRPSSRAPALVSCPFSGWPLRWAPNTTSSTPSGPSGGAPPARRTRAARRRSRRGRRTRGPGRVTPKRPAVGLAGGHGDRAQVEQVAERSCRCRGARSRRPGRRRPRRSSAGTARSGRSSASTLRRAHASATSAQRGRAVRCRPTSAWAGRSRGAR